MFHPRALAPDAALSPERRALALTLHRQRLLMEAARLRNLRRWKEADKAEAALRDVTHQILAAGPSAPGAPLQPKGQNHAE